MKHFTWFQKAVGIFSLTVFVVSAIFHLATFIPIIPVTMQMAWPLHIVTMATCTIMVFGIAAQQKRYPPKLGEGLFEKWRMANQQNKEFQSKLIASVPFKYRVACAGVFIYALINAALFMILMEGGSPRVKNGTYALNSHGQEIREISKEEYERFQAYEVRGFSGHWMVFSVLPMIYFLVVLPRFRESE